MYKLKPCPFCGSVMVSIRSVQFGESQVVCENCGAKAESYMVVRNAVDVWNRRTSEVKHGGWISVKERLPEEDGEYLIGWANSDEMYLSCFTRDCFGMSFGLRDEEQEHRPAWYYIDDEWGEVEWDNVEYWMEKPAPPETKGEEE